MGSSDLTILFITANELPPSWTEYQKSVLLEAANGCPIITISRQPLDWGINILDTEVKSMSNIYRQMLVGACHANTEYVAVAEDDTLYPREHFEYRPTKEAFAYNINRLNLFTWGRPTYFWKDRISNSTLIASRRLMIDALSERFAKYPEGIPDRLVGELGRYKIETRMEVTLRKLHEFVTENTSVVRFDHDCGSDVLAREHRKRMGILRSYDIPHWGRARDLVKRFV